MSKWIVILTNNSGLTVEIADLGFSIFDGVTRTVSDTFKFDELSTSADLKSAILANKLEVNDGTDDLSSLDGVEYIFLENKYHVDKTYAKKDAFVTHGALIGRNDPLQHTIPSISNLTEELSAKASIAYVDAGLQIHVDDYHALSAIHTADVVALSAEIDTVSLDLSGHMVDITNPHLVTQTQVGLSNVDNTSDLDKPISTATQSSLDLKADNTDVVALSAEIDTVSLDLSGHMVDVTNPHNVTQTQVGLSNVDNTSDINKPVSIPTQSALNLKSDITYVDGLSATVVNNYSTITESDGHDAFLSAAIDTNKLQYWTEGYNDTGLNVSVPVASWTPSVTGNVDIVLAPHGTGAILARTPYVGVNGSDKRGLYALDLQRHGASNDIASGDSSVIVGGYGNAANGYSSVVVGGSTNTASSDFSFVGCGYSNTANGDASGICCGNTNSTGNSYAFVGGGYINAANGIYSCIGGGRGNITSGDRSSIAGGYYNNVSNTYSTIGGGAQNNVTSINSTIAGGQSNTVQGSDGFIGGGRWNKINSGTYSVIVGGGGANSADGNEITLSNYASIGGGHDNNITNSPYSCIPGGQYGTARTAGQLVFAGGRLSVNGDAQSSVYVPRTVITSSTKTWLSDTVIMTPNQTMSFIGTVTARTSGDVPDIASWKIEGVVSMDTSNNITIHDYTVTVIFNPTSWTIDISEAISTKWGIGFTATGWTENIHAVANIQTSEVIFA